MQNNTFKKKQQLLKLVRKSLGNEHDFNNTTIQEIVIPWVVRLYVEIIHGLLRVDYFTYRWTNMVQLFHTTNISVDLAHHELFHDKDGKCGINVVTTCKKCFMILHSTK